MASVFERSLMAGDTAYQNIETAGAPLGWTIELRSGLTPFLATEVGKDTNGKPIIADDFVKGGGYQGFLLRNTTTNEWALVSRGTVGSVGNLLKADLGIAAASL